MSESEDRFRQLAESLPQLVWTCRVDGRCDYLSPQWVKYTGIPASDQLGTGWLNRLHPDDRERTIAAWNAAVGAGSFFDVEFRIRRYDGVYRWFSTRAIPLRDKEGRVTKWFGSNTEVEDRKRLEEALQQGRNELEQRVAQQTKELQEANVRLQTEIATRKWTEDALQKNAERFAQLAQQSRTVTWEVNAEGLYTYMSDVAEVVFGYRADELVGIKHFYDLHPESEREAFKTETFAVFGRKEPFVNFVNPLQTKDGRMIWVSTNGIPVLDDHGELLGYRGADADITERKLMEESLKESEENFRRSLDDSPLGVRIVTAEGETIYANRAILDIYGFSSLEELRTTPVYKRYTAESYIEFKKRYKSRHQGADSPSEYEISVVRKNGAIRNLLVSRKILLWNGKKQYQVLYRDITERKQAEEALRESETRYRTFIDATSDMVFLKDESFRYLISNGSNSAFLGQSEVNVIGCTDFDFMPAEAAERCRASDREALAKRGVVTTEEIVGPNTYHAIKFPVPLPGGRVGVGGYIRDITEHKRAEKEKAELEIQNRQLQKAESLGRMAGAIAHQFNNQLQVVMGSLELAINTHSVATLADAMQAARKAAEVSHLMLIYLGKTPGKLNTLDLSDACRRNLPLLRATMSKRVVLEADLPSPGPIIRANADQIQQILHNLVTNAWEAIGDGLGVIHLTIKTVSSTDIIAAHRLPIDWQPQNQDYACLEVTDTGCGIAPNDIEKLFDPFFSTKFIGRGLGLSVVLGIVRAYEGCVTVASGPSGGSVFQVFFPVHAQDVPRPLDKAVPAPEYEASGTVLLVEDEQFVRKVAATVLARMGFTVLEAKDGVEAIEVFRQHRDEVRCVVCDLSMPRMNGWETIATLRALRPDLPVVLASGYDQASVMNGDHPEQPQIFLGKPYTHKELGDALGRALVKNDRHRTADDQKVGGG